MDYPGVEVTGKGRDDRILRSARVFAFGAHPWRPTRRRAASRRALLNADPPEPPRRTGTRSNTAEPCWKLRCAPLAPAAKAEPRWHRLHRPADSTRGARRRTIAILIHQKASFHRATGWLRIVLSYCCGWIRAWSFPYSCRAPFQTFSKELKIMSRQGQRQGGQYSPRVPPPDPVRAFSARLWAQRYIV